MTNRKNKQYECDWEFFKKLGKKIAEEPYEGYDPRYKAEILAQYFWDELRDWKYEDIWNLFREQGVIGQEMDVNAFKMMLYRAGLKKYTK